VTDTTALAWEDVDEGATSPEYLNGPITRTDIVRYAGAGGDFNPIHHDEAFATSIGLPSIFSMGLQQAGFLSHLVSDWLGLANVRTFDVRFAARVWPGETLRSTGRVARKFEEDGVRCVEVELVVVDTEKGEVKITGSATAALPS
jgi:acyl dehydratase